MSSTYPFRLFERTGVELEYMIVDRGTLAVAPIADQVMLAQAGTLEGEAEFGAVHWSNELALHVIELKTGEPVASLADLPASFGASITRINTILAPMGARLMPAAMHPWMDPAREMRLWPHDHSPVYQAFDRIFSCRGHGWANLQAVHINLPFGDDQTARSEFGRLHAAIRLVLPILPALAASSPIMEGRATGVLDNRLAVYRTNSARVPSMVGRVIPEPVFTRAAYEREILGRIYADLAPHDPEGVLRHEWANARGCIARFDRGAIEIRVLDVQECPLADLAIAGAIVAVLRRLVAEDWIDLPRQQAWDTAPLAGILDSAIRDADRAVIRDADYLAAMGHGGRAACTAGELWQGLVERCFESGGGPEARAFAEPLGVILRQGPLARRILAAMGEVGAGRETGVAPDREHLRGVYGRLADCLRDGHMFI